MFHASFGPIIKGDSWLLMVRSQIDILIPGLSFGYNLCCEYSNGSCKPILNIYVLKSFQWYKNFSIQWILTPQITFWKFGSLQGLQFTKWESTWECVSSFLHIFLHSQECDSQVALLARTFPCLCLGHEPKVRVVTIMNIVLSIDPIQIQLISN
jgi:hypothetical protein